MIETLKTLAPLAWRNIWRNPRRTVITLIVVAVGIFSILIFAAFLRAWAESSRDRVLTLVTSSIQIHAEGFPDDPTVKHLFEEPSGALAEALDHPDIDQWAPRLLFPAILQSEYRTMPITLIGVDPEREAAISVIPSNVSKGTYLSGRQDTRIILGERMLSRLKTRLGKRVIVLAQAADGSLSERGFEVGGIFSGDGEIEGQFAFVGLDTARDMLGTGKKLAEIAIRVPDPDELTAVVQRLRAAAPDLDIRTWKELSQMAAAVDQMMGLVVYVWLWVMFVLMAIGIINTQLMAVFERIHEFGLMQALGMCPRMILGIVSLESAILVGLGILIGMMAAVSLIGALSGGVDISTFAEGAAMIGAGTVLYPKLDPPQIIQQSLVVWVLGVAVAFWPARKAAKISPVEAMIHVS